MERGDYLEDGANLYQLLGFTDQGVILEDCYLEAIMEMTFEEVAKAKMRKVERAAA